MTDDAANDDSVNTAVKLRRPNAPREPDAHGQAAMLLVESLIHGLIAGSVISVAEAVKVVDIAAEVKAEVAADLGDSPDTMRRSLALLKSISGSLRHDMPAD